MSSSKQAGVLLLTFADHAALLGDTHELPFSALGFPSWVASIEEGECWAIEPRNLDLASGRLSARIVSYSVATNIAPLPPQIENFPLENVSSLEFMSLDTAELLKVALRKSDAPVAAMAETSEAEQIITVSFRPYIKALTFRFGSVSAMHYINEVSREVEISIQNVHLRPEFDAVKNYFEKVAGKKRIQVNAEVTIRGDQVLLVNATSEDIQKITEEVISSVKFEFVKDGLFKRKIFPDVDVNLHTMEELFSGSPEREAGKNFFGNEHDLMEYLLNIPDCKHYQMLRYLSSKHDFSTLKLRFVLEPFSFVFLLTGERGYHIIWETLDTEEATYIWQIEKRKDLLKLRLQHISGILNTIRHQGKQVYLKEAEEGFHRLVHEYQQPDKGFVKWKHQLDEMIF